MMNALCLNAKVNLATLLPVPIARRLLQWPVRGDAITDEAAGKKQLLIDVSVIINNDARTGIQRVVRALLLQLLRQPPDGWQVRPIFATRKHGYRYAPAQFGLPDADIPSLTATDVVTVGTGDLYLGLDLAAHLLHLHGTELAQWKRNGAEIHFVVYDLLPVLHPQWFKPKTTRNFRRWLRTIAIFADSIICISNTVKAELAHWLQHRYALPGTTIPIHTIPLGADIQASAPSSGLPDNIDQLLREFGSKPTVLMVGTLEPRKGHSQVLAAFEALWQQGRDINLVIVGKPGWKTEPLQRSLLSHPQNRIRLHWLDSASDELLELLYTCCTGVVVASRAEGFGLPLIEAVFRHKPVLARDIPVFREIGGSRVTFFSGGTVASFASDIDAWLAQISSLQPRVGRSPNALTWHESAEQLLVQMKLPALSILL
ncbi:glycosyltransferase family 1 protein [Actimicrobium sp. CCI2.3]|uniref:glycosyltransferase family 4 protein n=1 Tax=Actimicrobium sp. CCI2.3 TaxID=3048616 RepID=UPI002AB33EA5|nr:glycosyltransferase family 1 protein [Actimicrobium sp. CCI2.3]MDY7573968.1 glycosyltransferase family 1 protein [Actimicrobium sp. CCI2.3]MEB0023099.1 glycosyltransferase family 1 protein [Actimicrobium sp. CCI2.3]